MRLLISGLAIAGLLVSGVAVATPGKESGTKSTPAEPGGAAPSGGEISPTERQDTTTAEANKKSWEVGADWENHTMICQSCDLAGGTPSTSGGNDPAVGSGSYKEFNYFSVYVRYEPTEYDRITLRGGLVERFLADSGESGVRLDDTALGYVRRIPLPAQFTLRTGFSVYFPTSYASQLQSLRFAPRLSLDLEKKFGKYVSADVRLIGDYYNCQYSSAGGSDNAPSAGSPTPGGDPNAEWRLATVLEAEASMPFLDALALGASVYNGYIGYYEVGSLPLTMSTIPGGTADQQFANQPVQQEYGGEIFARYTLPTLARIKSDITLALADGDPSLGYASLLHDGVQHTYPLWRQNAEVYGVLSAHY